MRQRRNKSSSNDGLPPGHAQESSREHRAFLIRSLERNDVDMAAIVEANRSLHQAKRAIVDSCGEAVLLDIGCGELQLVNDELLSSKQHHLSPAQKEVCIHFLQLMKLRRKLSNRLARRLNRVAHAMDGEDVKPPPAPRYGDLRLNVNPKAVQASVDRWKAIDEAKMTVDADIKERKRKLAMIMAPPPPVVSSASPATTPLSKSVQPAEGDASKKMKTEGDGDGDAAKPAADTSAAKKEAEDDEAAPADVKSSDQTAKKDTAVPAASPEAGTVLSSAVASAADAKDAQDAQPKSTNAPAEKVGSATGPEAKNNSIDVLKSLQFITPQTEELRQSYEFLKEYDDAYQKKWDPTTNKTRYMINESDFEADYAAIKLGAGIGATHNSMTAKEKEMEFKRWQTALLSRIPDQPTFEDLGLANRVYRLEARRLRCLEQEKEKSDEQETEDSAKSADEQVAGEAKAEGKEGDDDKGEEIGKEKKATDDGGDANEADKKEVDVKMEDGGDDKSPDALKADEPAETTSNNETKKEEEEPKEDATMDEQDGGKDDDDGKGANKEKKETVDDDTPAATDVIIKGEDSDEKASPDANDTKVSKSDDAAADASADAPAKEDGKPKEEANMGADDKDEEHEEGPDEKVSSPTKAAESHPQNETAKDDKPTEPSAPTDDAMDVDMDANEKEETKDPKAAAEPESKQETEELVKKEEASKDAKPDEEAATKAATETAESVKDDTEKTDSNVKSEETDKKKKSSGGEDKEDAKEGKSKDVEKEKETTKETNNQGVKIEKQAGEAPSGPKEEPEKQKDATPEPEPEPESKPDAKDDVKMDDAEKEKAVKKDEDKDKDHDDPNAPTKAEDKAGSDGIGDDGKVVVESDEKAETEKKSQDDDDDDAMKVDEDDESPAVETKDDEAEKVKRVYGAKPAEDEKAVDEGEKGSKADANTDDGMKNDNDSSVASKDGDDDDDADGDADDEDNDSDDDKDEDDDGEDDDDDEDDDSADGSRAESQEEEEEEEHAAEPPKRIKPMNLTAVPSFYNQDLRRIKLVHGDIMSASMQEHINRRLSKVTHDYNTALQMSTRYQEKIRALEHDINRNRHESRQKLTKLNNEYNYQVSIEKKKWLQEKLQFQTSQAKTVFPSSFGHNPLGTHATARYVHHGGIAGVIGTCIADIVDGSIIIAEGKAPRPQKFRDFVPPPPPPSLSNASGESLAQKATRLDEQLRHQHQECITRLKQSEEERAHVWKRLMKTRAEYQLPQSQHDRHGGRIDMSNYHLVPMPGLGGGQAQIMTHQFNISRPKMASYTPPSTSNAGVSESKYSAARVRARISRDGSVAPVTEPKKTKDGLYQRPAGRTRKGMQWDAVKGIWVPE